MERSKNKTVTLVEKTITPAGRYIPAEVTASIGVIRRQWNPDIAYLQYWSRHEPVSDT